MGREVVTWHSFLKLWDPSISQER